MIWSSVQRRLILRESDREIRELEHKIKSNIADPSDIEKFYIICIRSNLVNECLELLMNSPRKVWETISKISDKGLLVVLRNYISENFDRMGGGGLHIGGDLLGYDNRFVVAANDLSYMIRDNLTDDQVNNLVKLLTFIYMKFIIPPNDNTIFGQVFYENLDQTPNLAYKFAKSYSGRFKWDYDGKIIKSIISHDVIRNDYEKNVDDELNYNYIWPYSQNDKFIKNMKINHNQYGIGIVIESFNNFIKVKFGDREVNLVHNRG